MGKVTIASLLLSTAVLLVAFGQAIDVLRGGDVAAHLRWGLAALLAVLGANFIAIVHAAQSDRIIRRLRARVRELETPCQAPAGADRLEPKGGL